MSKPLLDSTQALLQRVRTGDEQAREDLVQRFLPGLRRWAHGRLPAHARDLMDTNDLVSVALVRALRRVDQVRATAPGGFFAYLRTVALNCLRDELRRAGRRPPRNPLTVDLEDDRPALLEATLGRGMIDRYQRALESLSVAQQEAVILRIEFGFTFEEIARALGRSSANAVRMQVTRAILRLAEAMDDAS